MFWILLLELAFAGKAEVMEALENVIEMLEERKARHEIDRPPRYGYYGGGYYGGGYGGYDGGGYGGGGYGGYDGGGYGGYDGGGGYGGYDGGGGYGGYDGGGNGGYGGVGYGGYDDYDGYGVYGGYGGDYGYGDNGYSGGYDYGFRPAPRPTPRPVNPPTPVFPRPAPRPASRPASPPASRPGSPPASRPGSRPTPRPASPPASRPASRPASPPASRPSPSGSRRPPPTQPPDYGGYGGYGGYGNDYGGGYGGYGGGYGGYGGGGPGSNAGYQPFFGRSVDTVDTDSSEMEVPVESIEHLITRDERMSAPASAAPACVDTHDSCAHDVALFGCGRLAKRVCKKTCGVCKDSRTASLKEAVQDAQATLADQEDSDATEAVPEARGGASFLDELRTLFANKGSEAVMESLQQDLNDSEEQQ